jgi:hypothetical protein
MLEPPFSSPVFDKPKSALLTMLGAGLLVGTLDISAATISYVSATGDSPANLLRYVASGAFGAAAFDGSLSMAIWGLVFHYCIAHAFTVLFFFAYPSLRSFSPNKIVTGLGYGIFVWLVMNLLVLPMTKVTMPPFTPWRVIKGMLILMLMIGLPLSLVVHRYYTRKQALPTPNRS